MKITKFIAILLGLITVTPFCIFPCLIADSNPLEWCLEVWGDIFNGNTYKNLK